MTTVVTVCSHFPSQDYYVTEQFFASLKHYNCTPVVLGQGAGNYRGLGSKPRLLKQSIMAGRIETDHMIFTDCFDVLFVDSPETVVGKSKDFSGRIVWNAEKNCFPDVKLAEKHPDTKTEYRYLNSGFAVGETLAFLEVLTAMKADDIPDDSQNSDGSWNETNDQHLWMREYLFGNVDMSLDTHCNICQTLHGVELDELDFSGEKIRNIQTDTFPSVYHLNGGSKTSGMREVVLTKLGL